MRKFRVNKADSGQRADVFVAGKIKKYPRSALVGLFKNGMVKTGKKVVKPGKKLHGDEVLRVDDSLLNANAPNIDLPVLYEDENVVVIDKPAGILTHSKGALNKEATVASFLRGKINDNKLIGNRAGIVHRLDRVTSGVIIGAKNAETMAFLQKQFSQRRTKKVYHAVVAGTPNPETAIIDAPIERNPKKPQTFRVGRAGKPAQTQYSTLKSFTKNGKNYSILELRPVSGRTHQLRVHLSYIGHPIAGDPVYGRAGEQMLLHAKSLEITLPGGDRRVFEANLPKYFPKP